MSDTPGVVAVTGATGLIGTALAEALRGDGIRVLRLVRRSHVGPGEISWRPGAPLDPELLTGVTAVVHLAGAPVGERRWSESFKDVIRRSRVEGTDTIARAVAGMRRPPAVLVSASAMGYYGDTGEEEVDESSPQGSGYFADVVAQWEAAADPAREAGIRVVHPRSSLVVSSRGGAWERMFPVFRAGIGGRLGNGRQYWSWISLRDEIAALRFLMASDMAGPVNLASPSASTNREVTAAMGEVLHRPTVLPVPAVALKVVLGGVSSEALTSIRVRPSRLMAAGFTWQDRTIAEAITAARSGW